MENKTTREKKEKQILGFINGGFPSGFILNPYKEGFCFITELGCIEFESLVAVSLLNSLLEKICELEEREKEDCELKIIELEKQLKQSQNQTAIAELEQLKHDIWTNQHDDGWLDEKVDIYELTEMIDQQIKSLKGENENV